MKLLASTKIKMTKDENGEKMAYLEITEVVLVHCDVVGNDYRQDLGVLYIFVPNKPFGQWLHTSPKKRFKIF